MNHRASLHIVAYATVYLICLLTCTQVADSNYRSHDGVLGRTMPAGQVAIVSGTDFAPYVYRQAVPQIRQVLMRVLQPGHAALGVDLLFALLAMICSGKLASTLAGPKAHLIGVLAATVACASVYPNDKPESVASVGIVCLLACLIVQGYQLPAVCVAALAAPFRPELPIVFAIALSLATLVTEGFKRNVVSRLLPYAIAFAIGATWLALAKWVWWPTAQYPVGTPPIMLWRNLATPIAWPGLVLSLLMISVGGYSALRAARHQIHGGDARGLVGLGILVCLWCVAMDVAGFAPELRLYSPLMPSVTLLVLAGLFQEDVAPSLKG